MKLNDLEVRDIYYALNLVPSQGEGGIRNMKLSFELRHLLTKISKELENIFNTTEESRKAIEEEHSIEKQDGMGNPVKIIDPFKEEAYNQSLTELFSKSENEFSFKHIPFSLMKNIELSLWQEQALEKIIDFDK